MFAMGRSGCRGSLFVALLFLGGCAATPDYFLIHPEQVPAQVRTWSEDHEVGELRIHLDWASPEGDGPFAAVIVHPHGGKTTKEMQGVIWDLASRGYLAVAADYQRMIDGKYRRNMFAWRSPEDVVQVLRIVRADPRVDDGRIAAVGFSQGGMLSLLMAAHAPTQLKTVVAWYPLADFNAWFERDKRNFIEDWVYAFMRRHFYKESGAASEEEFRTILDRASPLNYVAQIEVPVLLIHGDADTAAPVEESRKLYQALREAGKTVQLLEVPEGVHIFNWRQETQARQAWGTMLEWLHKYLGNSTKD